MAMTIKANDQKQKITLICDADARRILHTGQEQIFDLILEIDPARYTFNGKYAPLTAKYDLAQLSPYEKTLFVDADMVFSQLCDFEALWRSLNGIKWTMSNRGANDPDKGITEWVDSQKLKEAYPDVAQWYDLASEWIYWEKGAESDAIFAMAREFYEQDKLITRQFAGDKPDEVFFNLAMDELKVKPHKSPYYPVYWEPAIRKSMGALEIKKNYFAFSAGGNHLPRQQRKIYEEFVKNASAKLNRVAMNVPDKRVYLKERATI